MKKVLTLAALTMIAMSSCTKNEILDTPVLDKNEGKILFSASSGIPQSKAATNNPINSTGDLQTMGKFNVMGYLASDGSKVLDSVQIDWKSATQSWEYNDPTKMPYWPTTPMDFYSAVNWDGSVVIAPTGITSANTTIAADVLDGTGQKDYLVAMATNKSKETRTLMTFKHALTQIVFKAGNESSDATAIDVVIGGIEIVNVGKTSGITYTKANPNILWSDPTAKTTTYAVQGIGSTVATGYTVVAPTTVNDYRTYPRVQTAADPANNALMLIPQKFSAWDPNSGTAASGQGGAYIKVTALITKKGLKADDANAGAYTYLGTTIGGVFGFQSMYIPIESVVDVIGTAPNQVMQAVNAGAWIPGKRINYILTFGDTNSGSGGGGYDDNGEPILVPIKFRAVVEDWVENDVPLLSASVTASSDNVSASFIAQQVNTILSDIGASPTPKLFNANVTINGAINTAEELTATLLANFEKDIYNPGTPAVSLSGNFLPWSTFTFDFTGLAFTSPGAITLTVPSGWKLTTGALTTSAPGKVVLTKLPTTYNYVSTSPQIESHINAIYLNQKDVASVFNTTISVTNAIAGTFSSAQLSQLSAGGYTGSTVTINAAFTSNSVRTFVPDGWTGSTGGANIFLPGDPIALVNGVSVVLTKAAGNPLGHNWVSIAGLQNALNAATNGTTYYYNNVDYNVTVDFASLDVTSLASGSINVQLKYPVKAAQFTAVAGWSYVEATGLATYTK